MMHAIFLVEKILAEDSMLVNLVAVKQTMQHPGKAIGAVRELTSIQLLIAMEALSVLHGRVRLYLVEACNIV